MITHKNEEQNNDPYEEGSNSELEDICPYAEGSKEYQQWYMGLYDEWLYY